jgi:hypothetical protein
MDDVLAIYPESKEIRVARQSFETFRNMNPISIIKAWYSFIYVPYTDEILSGNVDFFVNKDYYGDINGKYDHVDAVMEKIDRVKELVSSMSPENKAHSAKYVLNLSRLSEVYHSAI